MDDDALSTAVETCPKELDAISDLQSSYTTASHSKQFLLVITKWVFSMHDRSNWNQRKLLFEYAIV